jgi:hypothetical protein
LFHGLRGRARGEHLKEVKLNRPGAEITLAAMSNPQTGAAEPALSRFHKLARAYRTVALIGFNTLVLFLLLNLAAWLVRSWQIGSYSDPVSETYDWKDLRRVYPDLAEDDLRQLLAEMWSRPLAYESYTHFKERPFAGRFVNVDTNGFRHVRNQGPWPPDPKRYNIFLFGGSTAFGYGVPDHQTIASYLQEILPHSGLTNASVYNFARGSYQSVQERILFEQLLLAGFVPQAAIWVDGLNEFYFPDGEPCFAEALAERFDNLGANRHGMACLASLPVIEVLNPARVKLQLRATRLELETDHSPGEIRSMADTACHRYLENKRLVERIAATYGVKTCFVWQPVPTYKYEQKHHPFAGTNLRLHWLARHGYERMAEILTGQPAGTNFVWCAEMQEQLAQPLYVDSVHYSAVMNVMLARQIAGAMVQRKLVP